MADAPTDRIQFLQSHASVRSFSCEPISETDELTIVSTAQRSATSSNLQSYSIVGVRQQAAKDELARLCGNQQHVSQCSLFLVFVADLHRLSLLAEKRGYRFNGEYTESCLFAVVDAALAADRALLAAQALGFGGVMVGAIRNQPDDVCRLLRLPHLSFPVMGMSLGKPAKPAALKPRLPLPAIYHRETYDTKSLESAVQEYDDMIEQMGHLHGREVQPELYPDFRGPYTWSEHSTRRMADQRPMSLRQHMLRFLQSRGLLIK